VAVESAAVIEITDNSYSKNEKAFKT